MLTSRRCDAAANVALNPSVHLDGSPRARESPGTAAALVFPLSRRYHPVKSFEARTNAQRHRTTFCHGGARKSYIYENKHAMLKSEKILSSDITKRERGGEIREVRKERKRYEKKRKKYIYGEQQKPSIYVMQKEEEER
jgi:hypothetical protein